MKIALLSLLALVLALAILGVITATPLVGEVVTLHTLDEAGEWKTTPLWIVESPDGGEYLRAGDAGRGWVVRMRANPSIRLERSGETAAVTIVSAPGMVKTVHDLMAEKYGWADDFVTLMAPDRSRALALRVERGSAAAGGS